MCVDERQYASLAMLVGFGRDGRVDVGCFAFWKETPMLDKVVSPPPKPFTAVDSVFRT